MPLFGLQCVIVVFPDHTHLILLFLIKLYTRQTDWKTWCSCSMQKVMLLEIKPVLGIDDVIAKFVFDKCVEKNGYVYFPDNTDIE